MSNSPTNLPCSGPVERRHWKRTEVNHEAFCQFKNSSNEEVFMSGRVTNVSRGGMKFITSQWLEPGMQLRVGIADEIEGRFTLLSSQVVYVCEAPGHRWFVGCIFTPKLREDIFAWIENIGAISCGTASPEDMLVG